MKSTHTVVSASPAHEESGRLPPAILFVVGLGESFLPGVLSISLVLYFARDEVFPMIYGSRFWSELGFVIIVILAFPVLNTTRRK